MAVNDEREMKEIADGKRGDPVSLTLRQRLRFHFFVTSSASGMKQV